MSYFARSGVGALAGSDVAAAPASQIANQAAMPPAPETTPKLIKRVDPQYPQLASSSGISGGVVLNAHIDEAGKVQAVQAISGDPVLVRAAVDAVRQWEYQPSLVDGQPRQSDMRIVITFSPQ
jgi:protein TonB